MLCCPLYCISCCSTLLSCDTLHCIVLPGAFVNSQGDRSSHHRRLSVEADEAGGSDDVMLRETESRSSADLISWNGLMASEAEYVEETDTEVNWFGSDSLVTPPEAVQSPAVGDLLMEGASTEQECSRDLVAGHSESDAPASKDVKDLLSWYDDDTPSGADVSPSETTGRFGAQKGGQRRQQVAV